MLRLCKREVPAGQPAPSEDANMSDDERDAGKRADPNTPDEVSLEITHRI